MIDGKRIAVVVPCFRVRAQVLDVIGAIDDGVDAIYVVDDACPEGSGDLVAACCSDSRVVVLRHEDNAGVGAAVMTGYRWALGAIVKCCVRRVDQAAIC